MSKTDETGQAELGDGDRRPTLYRVIAAAVPEDPDEPLRYYEIRSQRPDGFYPATNADTVRRRAFEDKEAEGYERRQKIAEERGIVLRSIPESSWGPDKPTPTKVEVERKTAWGT